MQRGLEKNNMKQCEAIIWHGPGHQSKTRCMLTGPHKIHKTIYGQHDQEVRWRGDEAFTGFFDDPVEINEYE